LEFLSGSLLTDATTAPETINTNSGAARAGKEDWIKTHLKTFARTIAPFTLLSTIAGVAHAAPTIDMSGVTSVMQTVQTACLLIGAIIILISLVFSVFSFAGGKHHARGHGRGRRPVRRFGHRPWSYLDLVPYGPGGRVNERVTP
jgi:hypothetical protein